MDMKFLFKICIVLHQELCGLVLTRKLSSEFSLRQRLAWQLSMRRLMHQWKTYWL